MKLSEFKALLEANRDKHFRLRLPDENQVPQSFHVTEVGAINKAFIDCGGKVHSLQICQLQVWVGEDVDHRIEGGKMADILKLAKKIVPDDDVELEIEYEDAIISQYPVETFSVTHDAVVLHLTTKHTDCLAKELCLMPSPCGATGCC